MKFLKVKLWGKEIGRLVWNDATRQTYFMYNRDTKAQIPDFAPLLSPADTRNIHVPIIGDEGPLYQGLPPFIADSLPDSWGNSVFDKWVKDNKIPRNKVTPLYKLMFIGTRGMGALEYEPFASEFTSSRNVDIKDLYRTALEVLHDRENITATLNGELSMQALLAVGTSAGGRQMKAIIAINDETGEIRSGQVSAPEGFEYYIIKFGDKAMPVAEIEMAYYMMAQSAGITMEESRLLSIDGINHFITKRFDRKNGQKMHTQTLAAMNPGVHSYEALIDTCRELALSECSIEQIFRSMVFNIIANNTDDHNKNFSFAMGENGTWLLAPAYDMTFIFNHNGTGPNIGHKLSLCGKTSDITKTDILEFARENNIDNASAIIDSVAQAISHFAEYADKYRIPAPWRIIIQKTLYENLRVFAYPVPTEAGGQYQDKYGRSVGDISITVNAKGHYAISASIDRKRRRRFIRPTMPLYAKLSELDVLSMSADTKIALVEALLPPFS